MWANPNFVKDITITDISSTMFRVSWGDTLDDDVDCVDYYFVHYWKANNEIKEQGLRVGLGKSKFFVDVPVLENTTYSVQVDAFEDGSLWAWCGDNWSKEVIHKTSHSACAPAVESKTSKYYICRRG